MLINKRLKSEDANTERANSHATESTSVVVVAPVTLYLYNQRKMVCLKTFTNNTDVKKYSDSIANEGVMWCGWKFCSSAPCEGSRYEQYRISSYTITSYCGCSKTTYSVGHCCNYSLAFLILFDSILFFNVCPTFTF